MVRSKTNLAARIPFHLLSDQDLDGLNDQGYYLAGQVKKARSVDVSGLYLWQRGEMQ